MNQSDIISISTVIGVIGTLILGFINYSALRKRESEFRKYNLNIIDYEKIRDFFLIKVAEYIALLDIHKLAFMALLDDQYDGKLMETYQHYYKLEICYYEIRLFLNSDNLHFNEFINILDTSLHTAHKLREENSMVEMARNALRKPEEECAEAYTYALKVLNISDNPNKLSFHEEAIKIRDSYTKKYLLSIDQLLQYKKTIVDTARSYLADEKNQVTGGIAKDK